MIVTSLIVIKFIHLPYIHRANRTHDIGGQKNTRWKMHDIGTCKMLILTTFMCKQWVELLIIICQSIKGTDIWFYNIYF